MDQMDRARVLSGDCDGLLGVKCKANPAYRKRSVVISVHRRVFVPRYLTRGWFIRSWLQAYY